MKLYLSEYDIKKVAEEHGVSPYRLLRAVVSNWDLTPEGANYARQMVLDAANANGPGMASRGDWAHAMITGLLIPRSTSWECDRCGTLHNRPYSDYCGPCSVGC